MEKNILDFVRGKFYIPMENGKGESNHIKVRLGRYEADQYVHQLVMRTFVGEPKEGQEVRHINGVPTDNRLENLKYGTRTENILDVYWQGKRWKKLRITEVRAIRNLLKMGKKPKELAEFYGVPTRCITRIKKGETFGWDK